MINAVDIFNSAGEASVMQISHAPKGIEYYPNSPRSWSSNGALIAAVAWPGLNNPNRTILSSQLDMIRADGSESTTVFTSRGDYTLQWSPDGQRLAFAIAVFEFPGESVKLPAVYILNAEGTGMMEVTQGENTKVRYQNYRGLAWSPDGKRLAYLLRGPWLSEGFVAQATDDVRTRLTILSQTHKRRPWISRLRSPMLTSLRFVV
jgi:Tol biopolymer transport system component